MQVIAMLARLALCCPRLRQVGRQAEGKLRRGENEAEVFPKSPSQLLWSNSNAVPQDFLAANNLRLIIRSHEGPDARFDRTDLPDMSQGFAIDHVTAAGRLITVFSAPDYPQFQAWQSACCAREASLGSCQGVISMFHLRHAHKS